MTPEEITRYFSAPDGAFRFARWNRPLASVVFGTDDATLGTIKDAIREVAALCDLGLGDVDPEFGANFLVFFCRDWNELPAVKDLDQLIPDLSALAARLQQSSASQYRIMRHAEDGSIGVCVNLIRMDDAMEEISARDIALGFTVKSLLLWAPDAFEQATPLGQISESGYAIVKPEIAALLRAAYDPVIPLTSNDPALAYRLSARASLLLGDLETKDEA